MESPLCNNVISVPPWTLFLVIALFPAIAFYLRYRRFQEDMEEYRYWKNKRREIGEEIEEVDLPDYHRFLTVEVFLALLAFGTALLGFLSTNNITYAFTINQVCIVSGLLETPAPEVTPDATPLATIAPTDAATSTATPAIASTATDMPTSTVVPSPTPPGNLGPGSPLLSDYNYWLAASIDDGDWGLWELDTNTGEMQARNFGLQNNSQSTQMFHTALSPNGQEVAFTYGTTCVNSSDCNRDIYIGNVASDTARQVTDSCGDEANPEWSPDGRFLTFHAHPIPGCADDYDGIMVLDLSTNRLYEVVRGAYWNPTWSPDAQRMVINGVNGVYGIEFANCFSSQTCSVTPIYQGPAGAPAWIDFDTIVFPARIEADWELYSMDVTSNMMGVNMTQLTFNDFDDQHPTVPYTGGILSWQAFPYGDGDVGAAVDANADLYVMDLQSGNFVAQPVLVGNNINNFRDASLVRKSD